MELSCEPILSSCDLGVGRVGGLSRSLVEAENCFGFAFATCAKGSSSGTDTVSESECGATLKWLARCGSR